MGAGQALVEGTATHHPPHPLLDLGREAKARQLLLQRLEGAVAPAVAVEASRHVRREQLLVRETEGSEDVPLLTQEVLLVVAGGGGEEDL